MPPAAERADRLGAVLHVLYLIFNEEYVSTSGPSLHRAELSAEAIRLIRIVHLLMPDDVEVTGLLALMLLTDARRPARTAPDGAVIPMAEQDRSRWNSGDIAEGVALISSALPRGTPGPYQLQAAIAAIHDEAPTADATDWPQILALYQLLLQIEDNPVVALNHTVAVDGARPRRGTRAAGRPGRRRADRRGPPARRRARPSAGTGRKRPRGAGVLPSGRRPDHQHSGPAIPVRASGPAESGRLSGADRQSELPAGHRV